MRYQIEKPNPKQKEFLTADNRFVGYGGARGGGKSWAVRKKAVLLALNYPGIRVLILRRSFPELRQNHINPLLAETKGIASYRELDKTLSFPTGSVILFGYCDNEGDLRQYQGNEYDVIFLDEATQIPYEWFIQLTACLRGANSFPKRFYLTCNPGGVGHDWVKRLFIDRNFRGKENPEDYRFIPAKVYDNAALLEKDQGYVTMLENLPDDLRRAWLEGDWDIFEGQYFPEFRREIHVCEPFPIPSHWRRYFAMDYGLDMLAGYWIAMDELGQAWVYRELYRPGLIISQAAGEIREMTPLEEEISVWYAPPDMWNRRQDTGHSVADIFAGEGIPLVKASNDRIQGWMNVKEWLLPRPDQWGGESPRLKIFSGCINLIRCLPLLRHDPKRPGDCAAEPHELTHAPDALRYFLAGRPLPGEMPREREEDEAPEYEEQVDSFLQFGG